MWRPPLPAAVIHLNQLKKWHDPSEEASQVLAELMVDPEDNGGDSDAPHQERSHTTERPSFDERTTRPAQRILSTLSRCLFDHTWEDGCRTAHDRHSTWPSGVRPVETDTGQWWRRRSRIRCDPGSSNRRVVGGAALL